MKLFLMMLITSCTFVCETFADESQMRCCELRSTKNGKCRVITQSQKFIRKKQKSGTSPLPRNDSEEFHIFIAMVQASLDAAQAMIRDFCLGLANAMTARKGPKTEALKLTVRLLPEKNSPSLIL